MSRGSLLSCAALALGLTVSGLAATTPANAVSYVSVSVSNTIRLKSGECGTTTVSATGDWWADAEGNIIDISVYDPNGDWVDGDVAFDESTGSISYDVELCDFNDPGTYDVEVEVTGFDSNYGSTTAFGSDSFELKVKPPKQSKVKRVVRRIHRGPWRYAVPGRLIRAGRAYTNRPVWIQAKIEGDWYDIERQYTNNAGYFGWVFKPNAFSFRYSYDGNATTAPSTSLAFRVPRGHGRVTTLLTPEAVAELVKPAGGQ